MALDSTTATFGGTEVVLSLDELNVVSDGVQVYLGHEQPNFREDSVTLDWQVFVGGNAVASPTPFTPRATKGAERETVAAEPDDVIDVVVTDGSTEASVSGTVPGDPAGGGGNDDPIDDPPGGGPIEIIRCNTFNEVRVGETASVSVTVRNTGGEQADATVVISAGGATDETQVSLTPGTTQIISSAFEFDESGDYAVNAQVV